MIADDVMLLRSGLARLLTESGIDVVAECADADELLRAVDRERPDVADRVGALGGTYARERQNGCTLVTAVIPCGS